MISGLAVTFIEAPEVLDKTLEIPEDHFAACQFGKNPVPLQGNAAGRGRKDGEVRGWLVLDGQPSPPGQLPSGFTRGGVVALVMSCVTGILGVGVVGWYGFSEPVETKAVSEKGSDGRKSLVKTRQIGDDGGVGLFDGAVAAPGRTPDVGPDLLTVIRRGTEAVDSEAVSFGSEAAAVDAVGTSMSKRVSEGKGNEEANVDAITRVWAKGGG